MRSRLVVPVLLAACLVSVAFAASGKVVATFQSLSASGVGGEVVLKPMPGGGTLIHASIEGLAPSTEYFSNIYVGDQTCGTTGELVISFTSNPQGKAIWNEQVARDLQTIGSVSVQRRSDNALQACADVTP